MSKVSALTADATPTTDDLLYTVEDPGGTPLSRKATIENVLKAALGQEHIYIPSTAMATQTVDGADTGRVTTGVNDRIIETFDFDQSTDEYVQFHSQMPKSWNEGTLVCQFIWTHTTGGATFDVVWGIQANAFGDGDALDAAWGTAVTVTDSGATGGDLYRSAETSAMTVSGASSAEEEVYFRVYRDANNGSDTLDLDANLIGVKIHWTKDALNED